ncbi:hypothetical protein Vi05172_g4749 [Venturia inaequalis]|nr:hypothetical protein Vi05172_g4749 [Venturia inaequalis]
MTSPGKELKRLSITRAMEEAPAHACDYCGVMAVHQCSAAHPVAPKLGGCPLFSFYCSLGHQLLDSQNHLEKCEKEEVKNKLVDIARTIQDCWLVIRQNTWDHDVKSIRIDESGTKGIVVCELGDGEKFAGGQVFHEFDKGLVEELETKFGNVHDAVLTAGTSEHAVACLYKLVEYLLRDSATQIEEIRVSPSVPLLVVQNLTTPNPSQTQALAEFNHASNHWVYKITTKTGEEYALDITGIQYGNDCVCSRWEEAQLSHRVFGESHTRLQNVANTQFATLEAAFREMNWMLLSTIFDLFVEELSHMEKNTGPLGRQELVRSLEQILKDIPVDAVSALGDFRDWVGGSCDTPTPLAKMLGRVAPGVVPRGMVVSEEVGVELDEGDAGDGVGEEVTENMYDRYLRTGKVGCTLL